MTAEIKLKRAYGSNFMSLGNNVNEFIFEEDGTITWIKGPNGVGKSVMIELLAFTFFGRPYRKIKKNSGVRNTSNQDSKVATLTGVEFIKIIGDTIEEYDVKRRMTKSGSAVLIVYKDGVEQKKAAGMSQKKLEEEILGFDYTIFENIISLNTIQTIPIIDMPPDKKRKLLESIATIHLDKLKKINKETFKDMQVKFKSATSDVEQYTKDTEELVAIVEKLEEEKKAGIKDLQDQVKKAEEQREIHEKEKVALEKERDELKQRGIKKKEELDKYTGINDKINNYRSIITHLEYLEPLPDKIKKKHEAYIQLQRNADGRDVEYSEMEYDSAEHDIIKTSIKTLEEAAIDYLMNVNTYKNQLDTITEDAKNLKAGEACITCGKPSTKEDVEKIKTTYREKYKKINVGYKEQLKLQSETDTKLEELKTKDEELNKKREEKDGCRRQLESDKKEATTAENELGALVEERDSKKQQITELFKENGDDKMLSIDEVNTNIEALTAQRDIQSALEADLNDIRVEATQKIEGVKALRNNITTINEQIATITSKIDAKNAKNLDDACARTTKKLEDTKQDLGRANERVTKYSDEVSKCKYIEGMFADNGIKQIILQAFVPNLNKAIAHNLSLFELPFSVEFNDAMEYEFTGRLGMAQEYGGLSQGQTRKLNFAITIAFRDFVAAIADFKINILFLDEVLDISTDDEALEHMLQLLKTKVGEVGQIYLMTHRGQYFQEYFDNIIEIEHDGRYSTINKIK